MYGDVEIASAEFGVLVIVQAWYALLYATPYMYSDNKTSNVKPTCAGT